MSSKPLNVGIIGCGKICNAYFAGMANFPELIRVAACADLDVPRAKEMAASHGVPKGYSVQELLADPEIDIVVNLTIPQAHAPVNLQAIEAGKHVYVEKPFALNVADAEKVMAAAAKAGVYTACAPDTFLGGGIQTCRKLIEEGVIGEPIAAVAFMACPGHESWHPSPEFYYKKGGGPLFDMGPYYLTALVNLIGPIRRISATTRMTYPQRTITSQPLNGTKIDVETTTHVAGTLEFGNGAIGTMIMSFDVWKHHLPCIEIYGTKGSISVPDPNAFDGEVKVFDRAENKWVEVPLAFPGTVGRGVGVADLAGAIINKRPNRASGQLATHVVEAMEAFDRSSAEGRHITLHSTAEKPAPLLEGGKLDEVRAPVLATA